MGHRANLIIKENEEVKIYCTSSRAQETPGILAQGLEFCLSFFPLFNLDGALMDCAWSEGGILIDMDKRSILIFGGADISMIPALQRKYCQYIKNRWNGWSIRWASMGNVDFAEYLNLMEDRIIPDSCLPDFYEDSNWSFTYDKNRPQYTVVTIINEDSVKDYKTDWSLDGLGVFIVKGEELKNIVPDELLIEGWSSEIDTSECLLIDYNKKKIFTCWGLDTNYTYEEEIRGIWKDWEVERQSQGLVFHFDYTNRDRTLVELTDDEFEKYVIKHNLLKVVN